MLGMAIAAVGGVALGLTASDDYDLLTRVLSVVVVLYGTLMHFGVF